MNVSQVKIGRADSMLRKRTAQANVGPATLLTCGGKPCAAIVAPASCCCHHGASQAGRRCWTAAKGLWGDTPAGAIAALRIDRACGATPLNPPDRPLLPRNQ